MKTLIDVLTALSDFVKIASEWAESASKAEVETFTQIYPQKEEAVKKAVEKAITLEEVRSVLANLSRSGQKETVLKLLQKYGGSRLSEVPPERYAALFADAQEGQPMPNKHAMLSASSSARWLACPPSAQLCAALPDTVTDYAREGTCAHELAEYKVQRLLGNLTPNPTENLDFYDTEMEDCTDSYAQYIAEQLANLQEPIVLVEQRLDFSRYVPSGFGTGDCVIVADDVLTVIDFKYGKGVAVSADHNSQMMLYALGALELFDALYDIAEIRMVIFQPRIQNLSECTMPLSELLHWAETELKPKAALAARGDGDFSAGEHCRFCKVKATCRKRAEYNLQLAKYDFAMPDKLTDTEIEAILETADQLAAWASDIKEYALQQSLQGKAWKNWKLVEGRARRAYCSEAAAAEAVQAAGFDPYEHKVLGITAMTRMLGKKKFEELLGDLLVKPQGKPTLVPLSDKRPAWNTAQVDFKE